MHRAAHKTAACLQKWKAGALLVASILYIPIATHAAPRGSQSKQTDTVASNPGFQEFSHNVDRYEQLRKQLESKLPSIKSTDDAQAIEAHEHALATKIAEAREGAKAGDVFSEKGSAAFRKVIQTAFSGPKGHELYKTMFQGEPLDVTLHINQIYPASLPATTVPPTLLLLLPKLPQGLEYRIIGRDFALEDVKARLLIDFIREVFPL